jgi:hypothetical protein
MHELLHVLEHALGLCGEKHFSFLVFFLDNPNLGVIFNYIKTIFK